MITISELESIEALLEELVEGQWQKVVKCGERVIPNLTSEDLLQPNDFPELENHPSFRYEEGVLEGMRTALTAVRASKQL